MIAVVVLLAGAAVPASMAPVRIEGSAILTTPDEQSPAAAPPATAAMPPLDRLVVIVRPTDYLFDHAPAGSSVGSVPPMRSLAGDLSWFLAVDEPHSIRLVGRDDLAGWHLDEDAAWARAIANVTTRVGPLRPTRLGSAEGVHGYGAPTGLAPSILADPARCGTGHAMEGQLVLVYDRDLFLFATASDPADVKRFWAVVAEEVAAKRSLSHTVLTCRAGKWETVDPPR